MKLRDLQQMISYAELHNVDVNEVAIIIQVTDRVDIPVEAQYGVRSMELYFEENRLVLRADD